MQQQIRNQLAIDPSHQLRVTSIRSDKRGGQDNEITCCEVTDTCGKTVAEYEIHDCVNVRPPFSKTLYYYRTSQTESPVRL